MVTANDSGSESDSGSSAASGSRSSSAASSRGAGNKRASPAKSDKSDRSNASQNRSRSNTPGSNRSRSGSRGSARSRSGSGSGSPASRRSGSGSPAASQKSKSGPSRSPSGSPVQRPSRPRKKSGSPESGSAKSQAGSDKSRSRSRSGSGSARSRSGSDASRKSNRQKSRSPKSQRSTRESRSVTPNLEIDDTRRSRSKSASSSGSDKIGRKTKKRAVISDSDSETDKKPKEKKQKAAQSDSENEDKEDEDKDMVTADALFGDASDISTDDEGKQAKERRKEASLSPRPEPDPDSESEKLSRRSGSEERRSGDEEEQQAEPEVEPEPVVETRIDADIPKIATDLGKELHFIKLPNFLSVETRPFDHENYEDEIDEEETLDEEGRARLKLKVENTIRWRQDFDKNGDLFKESNARFVKWSDGSMSLHLGSEIFDVYKQPLHGDYNHLFVRQGSGLLGQAVFRTKLTFRPHSTESFTHRKMTLSLADRSQKTPGIKILSLVGVDPDQDRQYQLKKEEQELRASMRAKGGVVRPGRRNVRTSEATARRTAGDDGSDDEGAISLQAIKNKYKSGQQHKPAGGNIYSSDDEASDVESRRARRIDRAKALQDSEDEDGSGNDNKRDSRSGSGSPAGSQRSGSESD